MTAIANARQTVAAPTRTARRFGLFSVVNLIDGGDEHWIMGGLTADGEECSKPSSADIVCGPTNPAKSPRSWFTEIEGDPWLSYMYETCKTVGRWDESATKLRARFLAAEQSAAELGFQENILNGASSIGSYVSVPLAIGALETRAALDYGGQVTIHMPFMTAEEASHSGAIERVGDHLETVAGNLVSIGNYDPAGPNADSNSVSLYATGAVDLYRSSLVEVGPTLIETTNDYFTLVERAYAAIVDCFLAKASATVCSCDTGGIQ